MIPHGVHTSCNTIFYSNFNDNYKLVLPIHFYHMMCYHGLQQLWVRGGIGATIQNIPIHTLDLNMGLQLCYLLFTC